MTKEERKALVAAFLTEHKGAVAGTCTGIVISLLLLFIGFFRTLLIVALAGAGMYLGRVRDRGEEQQVKEKVLSLLERKDK